MSTKPARVRGRSSVECVTQPSGATFQVIYLLSSSELHLRYQWVGNAAEGLPLNTSAKAFKGYRRPQRVTVHWDSGITPPRYALNLSNFRYRRDLPLAHGVAVMYYWKLRYLGNLLHKSPVCTESTVYYVL